MDAESASSDPSVLAGRKLEAGGSSLRNVIHVITMRGNVYNFPNQTRDQFENAKATGILEIADIAFPVANLETFEFFEGPITLGNQPRVVPLLVRLDSDESVASLKLGLSD